MGLNLRDLIFGVVVKTKTDVFHNRSVTADYRVFWWELWVVRLAECTLLLHLVETQRNIRNWSNTFDYLIEDTSKITSDTFLIWVAS